MEWFISISRPWSEIYCQQPLDITLFVCIGLPRLGNDVCCTGTAGEEVLVPMTGSLFVPGTIKSTSRVLVDVGTGFYVEKSPADAASILSKKVCQTRHRRIASG